MLPDEVLLSIFEYLDGRHLDKSGLVCSKWKSLVNHFGPGLYRRLCASAELPESLGSWRDVYRVQECIRTRNYEFQCLSNSQTLLNVGSAPLNEKCTIFVWPVVVDYAYYTALSGNWVCWISLSDRRVIHTANLSSDANSDPILPQHSLRGHTSEVGLILANNTGTLISFDQSSAIFVWRINSQKLLRKIETASTLEMILSLNIHHDRVIAGGKNGKIAVWNLEDGTLILSFSIPAVYLSPEGDFNLLNVAVYKDQIVYGLSYDSCAVFVTYFLLDQRTLKEMSLTARSNTIRWNATMGRHEILDPPGPDIEPPIFQTLEDARNPEIVDNSNAHLSSTNREVGDHDVPEDDSSQIMHIPVSINAPLTLILTSQFLVTNGRDSSSLSIWDLSTGQVITELSISRRVEGINSPSINFCELSNDGTCLFACTDNDELLIWNYLTQRVVEASGKSRKRKIDLVGLHDGVRVWIGRDFYG